MKHTFVLLSILLTLCGCSGGADSAISGDDTPGGTDQPNRPKTAVSIKASVSAASAGDGKDTEADNSYFTAGDKVGLFMNDWKDNATAEPLNATANHVNNMPLTYSDGWKGEELTLWKDADTPADFYIYYPYTAAVADARAVPFAVKEDQSSAEAFRASDFLTGMSKGVKPTEDAIPLLLSHAFSRIEVTLQPGGGFSETMLQGSDITVRVNNVKCAATTDMASATATAAGEARNITTWKTDGTYNAIIVPQTVEGERLISITMDGKERHFSKAFTFEAGKIHRFSITINNANDAFDIGITGWETDDIDHGGTAE